MPDRFSSHTASLTGPAQHGFPIVPSDASDLSEATRAIHIGVGGNIAVTMLSGANLVLSNVSSGSLLPIRVLRVLETGTTASNLVGLV